MLQNLELGKVETWCSNLMETEFPYISHFPYLTAQLLTLHTARSEHLQ